MKKHLLILIIGASVAAAFPSCKKYEDGPRLSMHTKKARIANVWQFDKVIASNGSTITSLYDGMTVEFKKDGKYVETQNNYSATGTWELVEDKEKIKITYDAGHTDPSELTIRRLTNKEFWFENGDQTYYCKPN